MNIFLLFFLIGLALASVSVLVVYSTKRRFSHSNTDLVFVACSILMVSMILGTIVNACKYSGMQDLQILNGQVVSKERQEVGCRHSYSCNCRTQRVGTGNNATTTTVCDTCYEHDYDVDWLIYTSVGRYDIDTTDRQGLIEPDFWTKAQPGDPASTVGTYTNYIMVAQGSLFNKQQKLIEQKYAGILPSYPYGIYNKYSFNHALPVNVNVPDIDAWNSKLAMILRELGPAKQVNVLVVFVNAGQDYAEALKSHWLGGKKNDVVVILGMKQYPNVEWVNVMSWTKQELFKIELRNAILDASTVHPATTTDLIAEKISKKFQRREMAEFEYLKEEAPFPTWSFVICLLLLIGGSFFVTGYAIKARMNV